MYSPSLIVPTASSPLVVPTNSTLCLSHYGAVTAASRTSSGCAVLARGALRSASIGPKGTCASCHRSARPSDSTAQEAVSSRIPKIREWSRTRCCCREEAYFPGRVEARATTREPPGRAQKIPLQQCGAISQPTSHLNHVLIKVNLHLNLSFPESISGPEPEHESEQLV